MKNRYSHSIVFIMVVSVLFSCVMRKESTDTYHNKTSEVRYEYLVTHDTICVPVPTEQVQNVTRDTFSVLFTSLAKSTACIDSFGMLHHYLTNRSDVSLPVVVDKVTEVRDSIVYVDNGKTVIKTVTKTVQAEVSWWQQVQIYGFWAMLALVLWAYRKNILKIIRLCMGII